jgi:hypothetical protein
MANNEVWGFLARYRSRLLLAPVPEGVDRNTELKRRLQHWERGRFDELVQHVAGQQVKVERLRQGRQTASIDNSEERLGRTARQKTAANAVSKAMKGLVGGVAAGSPSERERWAADLIPHTAQCSAQWPLHAIS